WRASEPAAEIPSAARDLPGGTPTTETRRKLAVGPKTPHPRNCHPERPRAPARFDRGPQHARFWRAGVGVARETVAKDLGFDPTVTVTAALQPTKSRYSRKPRPLFTR